MPTFEQLQTIDNAELHGGLMAKTLARSSKASGMATTSPFSFLNREAGELGSTRWDILNAAW